MPDKQGKLSKKEKEIVYDKFAALESRIGGDLVCEVCKNTNWICGNSVVGLKSDIHNPLERHIRMPSIGFVCSSCGNIKLFSAMFMGIEVRHFEITENPDKAVKDGD